MSLQIKPWYLDLIENDQPVLPSPQHLDRLLKFRNDHPEISEHSWNEFIELRKNLITTMQDPFAILEDNGNYILTFDVKYAPCSLTVELINIWAKALTWKSVKFETINTYILYSGFSAQQSLKINVTFSAKE